METLLKAIGGIALLVISFFYCMWVLAKIYAITMIPLGAPQIGFLKLYGILLFLSAATMNLGSLHKQDDDTEHKYLTTAITKCLAVTVSWGLAYWILG